MARERAYMRGLKDGAEGAWVRSTDDAYLEGYAAGRLDPGAAKETERLEKIAELRAELARLENG